MDFDKEKFSKDLDELTKNAKKFTMDAVEKTVEVVNTSKEKLNDAIRKNDMNNIKKKIEDFNKERDWDQFHTPENIAKSISIEAGELLECFQWDVENFDKEHVCEELADVFNYCFQMSSALNVDPSEIILKKMEKNAKKYPVDKAKGSSEKYDKL